VTADDDFQDVLASLRWAAVRPLTPDQRLSLKELCLQIADISEASELECSAITGSFPENLFLSAVFARDDHQ
jgi:hypothetical protein